MTDEEILAKWPWKSVTGNAHTPIRFRTARYYTQEEYEANLKRTDLVWNPRRTTLDDIREIRRAIEWDKQQKESEDGKIPDRSISITTPNAEPPR